ncbi:twin-arginine translocation signal domain-containing protein, partial [Natrinema soli]
MSAQSPRPTDSDGVSRRGFFKRAAIAGGAVVTVGAGGS